MLLYILIAIAAIVALFVGIVAMQPADFRVARTATIAARPSAVFAQINDFHNWQGWNPWGKLDPAMKQTYEGAPAGVGAIYSWVGNGNVGAGRMTSSQSRPSANFWISAGDMPVAYMAATMLPMLVPAMRSTGM